jgi:hypothetical protein
VFKVPRFNSCYAALFEKQNIILFFGIICFGNLEGFRNIRFLQNNILPQKTTAEHEVLIKMLIFAFSNQNKINYDRK